MLKIWAVCLVVVNNMCSMFIGCKSLESLPDISKWDIKNVNDMRDMFFECYSLKSLPVFSNFYPKKFN